MSEKQSLSTPITTTDTCVSRRAFIGRVVASAATPLLPASVFSACQSSKATSQKKMDNSLDQALDILFSTAKDHRGSNHVPMVAEALVALGRQDQVVPWVERYRYGRSDGRSPQDYKRTREISRQNWREALSDEKRRADWVDFFAPQIAEVGWQAVLREWVPRLMQGMAAFAAHGMIRTAHALRSLEVMDSPQRQTELAEGLGLWATSYQALPESAPKMRGTLKPAEAIRRVELMPPQQVRKGNIVTALGSLEDFPSFANAINLVDTSGDASAFFSDLTETFAQVYLANARDFTSMITLVHAVTGTSAARLLLPYTKAEDKVRLLRYGWQLAAGIYTVAGRTAPGKLPESSLPDKEELIDQAVKNGNAHPIKFTEACLREYALNPKPIYLVAARHAVENLRG